MYVLYQKKKKKIKNLEENTRKIPRSKYRLRFQNADLLSSNKKIICNSIFILVPFDISN